MYRISILFQVKKNILGLVFLLAMSYSWGQSKFMQDNTQLRRGNSAYNNKEYTKAEGYYRQSIEKNKENVKAAFNLGDALYEQKKYEEAAKVFESLGKAAKTKELQSSAYYNAGNAWMAQKKYKEAIDQYKSSLRVNPTDTDARYNLVYAMQKEKDKKENNQNKNNSSQDKKEANQNQAQNNPSNPEQSDNPSEKKPNEGSKMGEKEAEGLLEALKSEEEKVRSRYQKMKSQQQPPVKSGKEW
jgi:tetratricopeptide (TPR) repeat protein